MTHDIKTPTERKAQHDKYLLGKLKIDDSYAPVFHNFIYDKKAGKIIKIY